MCLCCDLVTDTPAKYTYYTAKHVLENNFHRKIVMLP